MRYTAMQMHTHRPVTGSAPCVEQLAASGALLVGKSNLHEIGVGMTGLNTRHGTTRNPYNPRCYTGGSSSGSAAAVSSGLCPFALGEEACCAKFISLPPLPLSFVCHTCDTTEDSLPVCVIRRAERMTCGPSEPSHIRQL